MKRLTAQEIIEDNKRIYAENNIKNLDDLNAYTLKTRLESKGIPCQLCGEVIADLSKGAIVEPWGETCGNCIDDIKNKGE